MNCNMCGLHVSVYCRKCDRESKPTVPGVFVELETLKDWARICPDCPGFECLCIPHDRDCRLAALIREAEGK